MGGHEVSRGLQRRNPNPSSVPLFWDELSADACKNRKFVVDIHLGLTVIRIAAEGTGRISQALKAMLEFAVTKCPLDCPICDVATECELQDATLTYGGGEGRFEEFKQHLDKLQCSAMADRWASCVAVPRRTS